ncbi:MAG TPA: Arm DNA-binding domain-containing protein [Azonexus sp.]|nr:Arm DNA-binding domain-containing protein [Azonexus sp.]
MGKLTDWQLQQWIASRVPIHGRSDGHGLTFTLSRGGTAAWVLRYRIAGQAKELTLGRYPDLSLAAARREAWAQRERIVFGIDVAAIKTASRREKGLIYEIATLETELQGHELASEAIRARLDAARLELGRKIEGVESWAS